MQPRLCETGSWRSVAATNDAVISALEAAQSIGDETANAVKKSLSEGVDGAREIPGRDQEISA